MNQRSKDTMKQPILTLIAVLLVWGSRPVLAQDDDDFDMFEEEFSEKAVRIADPLEPVNRLMFNFNDMIYKAAIKPVAQGYKKITPKPARISVRNFFGNLTAPIRYVNCVLQGKLNEANRELERFAANSTVGILGLYDPAKEKLGLEPTDEDLGQTLGAYGIGNGLYIVWPLLGPSTARDSVGRFGDRLFYPVTYMVDSPNALIAIAVTRTTNSYSFRIRDYDALLSGAIDPYAVIRDTYIQYRNQQINE
jgi:phospholipid-binding lipoprotein MlaA